MSSAAEHLDAFTAADPPMPRMRPKRPATDLWVSASSVGRARPTGSSSFGAVFLAWRENSPQPTPTRALFKQLASEEPARLAAWMLRGTLSRGHLSHAAEILGRETAAKVSADGVVLVLERLLAHPSPAVREGAVCGLAYHRTPRVLGRLIRLALTDPSDGVRQAIEDALED